VRCGVLSVVEYEVLLQGLVVLCSGLHSIVMLLYSTRAVQCIYSQYTYSEVGSVGFDDNRFLGIEIL